MATNNKLDSFWNREVPAEITAYTKRNLDLVDRIADRLTELGWSQNKLGRKLGKRPSQVSKWMTGLQNMTLLTVAEIEGVIGIPLLEVPGARISRHTRRSTVATKEIPIKLSARRPSKRQPVRERISYAQAA